MTPLSTKKMPRRLSPLPVISRISEAKITENKTDFQDFDRLCYEIFERLRPSLIDNYYNWFLLIEPNSGDYFLAQNELTAYQQARAKYPQSQFFFFRINETGVSGRL